MILDYKEYKEGKYIIKEFPDGEKIWLLNGVRHREDGPAYEYPNGFKGWWLSGRNYSEQDWKKEMRQRKLAVLGL